MKILDIGCSLGYFLLDAQERGFETYGVDISESSVEYAKSQFHLNVFPGTLESAHFPDKTFDIITLWDVVEHVLEPGRLLAEAKRVHKDDGILALQSPNMGSVMASLTKEQWNWWTVPDHVYHFTPLSISRLIKSSGYDVIKSYTWEPPHVLIINVINACLRLPSPSKNRFFRIIGRIISIFSHVAWLMIYSVQKNIWRRQKGGLIVLFARKSHGCS